VSFVRRAFAVTERRSAPEWGDSTPPPPGASAFSGGGAISETAALQVLAVYGSVGVIADAIATLPWERWNTPDAAKRRRLALTQLLTKPYVEISRMDWLTQYAMSMCLRGQFFGDIVERDQDFNPAQIKPMSPGAVRVRRDAKGFPEYRFNNQVVPVDRVFHVRNLSLPGSLEGLNPIEYLRLAVNKARMQDQYGASYFSNSANPEGVIETEDDLDPDEVLALAMQWIATHGGPGKAHLPAVLTGGAKFNPISINPKDSQFLESMQYSASAISGMIFRVPPHMIGIVDRSTSWGTGIEQQESGFVRNTLGRYIGAMDEAMTEAAPGGNYVRFDLDERLRGDKLARSQAHALDLAAGWMNADEVRDSEDMAPMPDGQGKFFHTPINSELLAQALQSLKDSQAAAPADPADQTGGADA
jgi:HK97 family phage portal protein